MGSLDRSKKRVQLWKKAAFHFVLCFVMGFFTGFTPTSRASIFSGLVVPSNQSMKYQEISPEPIETIQPATTQQVILNRSLMGRTPAAVSVSVPVPTSLAEQKSSSPKEEDDDVELIPKKHLIIITPTRSNDRLKGALLRRLSTTLKLVPPPLLWIVVESQSDSSEIPEILRKTGVMYRHLVYKPTFFTDPEAEMDHQRNFALGHIEYHRLSGIVHFAELSNFYDLDFFEEIREIEAFGAWPIALVSANRNRVVIEGPVCDSSQVIGWNPRGTNDQMNPVAPIHVSSFAFNSSILWDPERWGRPSVQDPSQNAMKFVQQVVLEDETKLKGIPEGDCSKIMLWNLNVPKQIISHLPSPPSPSNGRRR